MKPNTQDSPPAPSLRLDAACLAHAVSPLLWLPQAALIAWGILRLHRGAGVADLVWPAAGIVFAGVLRAVLEAWSAGCMFDTARERLSRWRSRTVAALAARSPLDRARMHAGASASALAEQAEAILPWLTRYRSAVWRARIMPALIVLPVAWFSWAAALVLLLAAPLIPMFMAIVGRRARAASEAQWLQMGSMNAFLLDRLRGLPTLRALGCVALTARRLRAQIEDLRQRTLRVLRIAFLSSAVLELFSALGVALVAVYIGFHLLGYLNFGAWGGRLDLAEALFILLLAPAFFEPLRELAAVWHDRAAGLAAADALNRLAVGGLPLLGGAPDNPLSAQTPSPLSEEDDAPALPPQVRIEGLRFAFPGEAPVFQDFALNVAPGERVALMAPSGTGKTVLLSLMAGLLQASQGRIEIGGTALTAASAQRLRQRMAWMGQRPHVFSGSVQHNVSLGRTEPGEGDGEAYVRQAICWAQLGSVAQAHPGTSLGEGGAGLSGGEAIRLALARLAAALHVSHADLLLADEPTAHLDSETAAQVTQSLLDLARGRTLIVATHDPALAARLDRSVVLPTPNDAVHTEAEACDDAQIQ